MKAAVLEDFGMPSDLDFPEPGDDGDGEAVQVRAAALTNLDILTGEGRHYLRADRRPVVAGQECVGCGRDGRRRYYTATSLRAPFGSLAEWTKAAPGSGLLVPQGVPDAAAAAIGNAGLAAWLPLSWRARLRPGESVIVLGATGTSGLLAVAAARLIGAGGVVAVGRNARALETARARGADATVRLHPELELARACLDAAGGPVDVVIDYLGGAPSSACLAGLAPGGRLIQVGSIAGPDLLLPAQLLRRGSLDVRGFAYYHAPRAEQQAARGGRERLVLMP